ncbi:ABC transporter ATP-binding protein [bacterium]|nr:ABC transporter ATP-binding protein [bacterium]
MLEVRELVLRYGAIEALHGISLRVEAGQIVTLIGANGAGKTSALRAISGLERAAAGSIWLEGEEITRLAPHEIVRRGVIHVPEGRGIFANLTVRENLELGAWRRRDRAGIRSDFERVCGLFPRLAERIRQSAGTLSGGEQQMLAIGRGLMAAPRVLLLDEPSLGLSPILVAMIFEIIGTIHAAGTPILLVEQNARLALKAADQAFILETGRVVRSGPAAELAEDPAVAAAYLGAG